MFVTPPALKWLAKSAEGRIWLQDLPARVAACVQKWKLELEAAYPQSFVSIVFPARRADGSNAVLKIQYPHAESDYEEEALRLWNGEGAVRLFGYDSGHHALLIERCEPGDHLSGTEADEALQIIAGL